MLSINNAKLSGIGGHSHKTNFTSSHSEPKQLNNSNALRNSLMALALLGMTSCYDGQDNFDVELEKAQKTEMQIKTDSINKNRSVDEYMQDLGFLQDGNRLGDVENIFFEDMNGTKHYLEKGDSVKYDKYPSGIQFHGIDIDKDGNREEYEMKFEKYHQGLIITKEKVNPDYEEGKIDTTYYERNGNKLIKTTPSLPKDTVTYRFHAKADGTYTLQKAEGKGIIFYLPIADVRKTSGGLLFEGYDWVNERRTDDINIINNFQNNVFIPKNDD